MATERLPMRHVREIFRQKLVMKRSNRQVATSLGISAGTVSGAMGRATALGLDWEAMALLGDDALEERLYGPRCTTREGRPFPDPAYLHIELRRTGVTLQLLHLGNCSAAPVRHRYRQPPECRAGRATDADAVEARDAAFCTRRYRRLPSVEPGSRRCLFNRRSAWLWPRPEPRRDHPARLWRTRVGDHSHTS